MMPGRRPSSRKTSRLARVRAFVLLEVVLSLALLLMGLTYIGAQIQNANATSYATEELTRLLMLADMKIAELDTGMVFLTEEADNETEGDFTLRIPDYGWRMRFDPTATEGLFAITLDILHAPRLNLDQEFEIENAEVVYTVHTLRAIRATADLQQDFGMDDEAIDKLTETLPIENFDPTQFDPSMLRDPDLDIADLITMLPAIMEVFGMDSQDLMSMVPPEFRELLDLRSDLEGVEAEEGEPATEAQPSSEGGSSRRDLTSEDAPPVGNRLGGGTRRRRP